MHENDQTYIMRAWELCALAEAAESTLMESVLQLFAAENTPLIYLRLAADRRAGQLLRLFFREGDREGFALAAELWLRGATRHT